MAPRFLSCPCSASLQNPYTPVRFRPAPPSFYPHKHCLITFVPLNCDNFVLPWVHENFNRVWDIGSDRVIGRGVVHLGALR